MWAGGFYTCSLCIFNVEIAVYNNAVLLSGISVGSHGVGG